MLTKVLKNSMPVLLNYAGLMKMADIKWNGLQHEKLFCEQPNEYTAKIDPISPKCFFFFASSAPLYFTC